MSAAGKRILFVDLDGTMVDPRIGILTAYQRALKAMGQPVPAMEELKWVIGPPMRVSFEKVLGGKARVEEAIVHYREYYAGPGLLEATPYEGVLEALTGLRAGARMFVCTSKPHPYARQIVRHFGFGPLYDEVYGSELDGVRDNKGELIAHMLERETLDPATVCMIGDREHDVLAAKRHGIRSVGVMWGFGGRHELTEAGATVICDAPEGLAACVDAAFRA
jgi:phosphoglycolate phosphatase